MTNSSQPTLLLSQPCKHQPTRLCPQRRCEELEQIFESSRRWSERANNRHSCRNAQKPRQSRGFRVINKRHTFAINHSMQQGATRHSSLPQTPQCDGSCDTPRATRAQTSSNGRSIRTDSYSVGNFQTKISSHVIVKAY